jgi:uncharacterized membrane protein YeiH
MYNSSVLVYILDLVGVFAFAFLGARSAIECRFNVWGIAVCAFLPALGGGTIRSLIIGVVPVYFSNHIYLYMVLAGAALSVVLYRMFAAIKMYVMVLDAIGMAAFSFIGAHVAASAHLGLFGSVAFATLTACGGGVLSDMAERKTPRIFNQGAGHLLPSVVVGVAYWLFAVKLQHPEIQYWLLGGGFAMQLSVAKPLARAFKKRWSYFERQLDTSRRLLSVRLWVLPEDDD